MSTIRRQSILSSIIVYIGFALGFLNTYFLTRQGGFTEAQYGLIGLFQSIATVMYSVACLGMPAFIYKFYPYYKDNLPPPKNDMATWALVTSVAGFFLVIGGGLLLKDVVIRKYGTNSPELVKYYYWIFPFGFGLTIYSLLEAFAWQLRKSVLTNFLKEVQFRLFTTLLIVLSLLGTLTRFGLFIKLFAFIYLAIAAILLSYLLITKQLHFTFSVSRVTRKFFKKIVGLSLFVWGGSLVLNLAAVFDTIVIAAVMPDGLTYAGIYTLAKYIANLIQAPQRALIAASVSPLSQAWKDKDMGRISRIYHRSSANLLLFSVAMYLLIWMNFTDGVLTFHLKKTYLDARPIFLFIGLTRIVDLGTGVTAQIFATSTFWRFDFFTGLILLAITLPFNYILTKTLGAVGPAIADLAAYIIYNGVRYIFLLRKFGMQPFSIKTVYTLLLGMTGYFVCHSLLADHQGFWWILVRSSLFLLIYGGGALLFRLSEDILPVWQSVAGKWKPRK